MIAYLIGNKNISLIDPLVIEGINWLESMFVIDPGRAAVILST